MSAICNERRSEKLALLVGSNPLPNYLAATVLQPKEVVLLYSPETVEARDRLEKAFKDKGIAVSDVCIPDATDVRKVRDACRSLQVDHLHYSGGTKPMAAHTRAMFGLGEAQEARASYLDERKGRLRFDAGHYISLAECELGLMLDLILALHGAERIETPTTVNGGPTESNVNEVCARVLNDPNASANFPNGKWLERWTAGVIGSCLGASTAVEVGVKCRRGKPVPTTFEIDVALVRGHRLYVVSCTTAQKKARCKSKLFEVAMRARHMGGDLARSALVCLLDGGDENGSYVDQLRSDIASVWDAPNVPAVFGLADLREWAGTYGPTNTGSLMDWLNS